jgi:hypothetical protein
MRESVSTNSNIGLERRAGRAVSTVCPGRSDILSTPEAPRSLPSLWRPSEAMREADSASEIPCRKRASNPPFRTPSACRLAGRPGSLGSGLEDDGLRTRPGAAALAAAKHTGLTSSMRHRINETNLVRGVLADWYIQGCVLKKVLAERAP